MTENLRVALVSDSHFDQSSRFDECVRLHDWIADKIEGLGVDLLLHGGDLFERRSTPKERNAAARWLQRCAEVCPVVIVKGNHDHLGDLHLLSELDVRHPVIVEEAANVHRVATKSGPVNVHAMAWPRKAELLSRLSGDATGVDAAAGVAGELLRDVLRGMASIGDGFDGPNILLAHAMVTGSMTSTGQPLVGCDMELGLADLALSRCDLIALGHIHKGQQWSFGGVPIVYPGSPRRTAYGEAEAKGFTVADFTQHDGKWTAEVGFVEVPAQRMILIDNRWGSLAAARKVVGTVALPLSPLVAIPADAVTMHVDGWCHDHHSGSVDGADIRFRYAVDAPRRDAAKLAAAEMKRTLLANGAAVVKVEEVVTKTVRARGGAITEAKSTADKLRALWAFKGEAFGDDQATRVMEKLEQLERGEA